MSRLREIALAAADAEREERAREAAELARLDAEKAVEIAKKSPLGEWFPDVEWEFLFEAENPSMKVVREKGETAPVFGVHVIAGGQGPDNYAIYLLQRPPFDLGALFTGRDPGYQAVSQPTCAGDVGRWIEENTPKTSPLPSDEELTAPPTEPSQENS